ncbi:MAG TPA: multicopper oxidase domain-containing protein [Egibacteraceae bacterium]|nr:multicopper oxidase domain-containing protein [Egibacteraceae bacterium]
MTPTTGAARLWAAIAASLAFFLVLTVAMSLTGTTPTSASTAAAGGAVEPTALTVEMKEFEFVPAELQAEAGSEITITAANTGQAEHNIALVDGPGSEIAQAGQETTLDVGALEAGTYEFICEVPGHAEAGMRGTLTVANRGDQAQQADAAAPANTGHSDHASMTPEEMVAGHEEGIKAFPAETAAMGNQPLEPEMDGDVKVFELTADEIEWEVSPGELKEGMAYNGQIPGPRLEANIGDTVRIVLHNELDVPTAIHPHGLVVPVAMDGVPGLTQDPVMPGESFTYEYTLRNAGSHMYHSHFDSAVQVPMGLLGAFIVHDDDEPEVDLDYTMILNDGPLGYTINGKGFPATEPLVVKQGQKVRVRYMNEGLQIHPMHLHGIPQQVIAKDGYPLPQPRTEDTVLIAPGERVDVIIDATEPGPWAFHCHILNHAEAANGMFGMVTALIVE